MTEECFRLDELDSLIDLDPEDPRGRHLAGCPLCRARLSAYRAFIAGSPPLPGSKPERADAGLSAFLDKMVHGAVEKEAGNGFLARFLGRRMTRRTLIPGLAAAALAAVILVIVLNPFADGDRQPAPLRGLDTPTAGALLSVQPAVVREGAVVFNWAQVPDSDRFVVQIFDAKLDEIARFDAGRDTSLIVRADIMPEADGSLFWRVTALREGDEIAHSRLLPLDIDVD